MVDSSFMADRILVLVEKAMKKMVPNLEVALAVDQGGGVCSNGLVAETKPETPLVILSGRDGLQDKVKNGSAQLFSVGPSEKWNSVKTKKTFGKWLPPEGLLEQGNRGTIASFRIGGLEKSGEVWIPSWWMAFTTSPCLPTAWLASDRC